MVDFVDFLKEHWNPANTHDKTPFIGYFPPHFPDNYNVGIILREIEDENDELGIRRQHQDAKSYDLFECQCIEKSKAYCREFYQEVRRICRLGKELLNDPEHSWLDWTGGRWGGVEYRKTFTMQLFAFRSGIAY